MNTSDGGPAFPCDVFDPQVRGPEQHDGMTLRDYFAAKALAALIAEPVEGVQEVMVYELSDNTCEVFAAAAYKFADAMLAERAK